MGRAERNAIPQYRPIPGSISSDPPAFSNRARLLYPSIATARGDCAQVSLSGPGIENYPTILRGNYSREKAGLVRDA
jgi:hypothetical protein